MRGAPYVRDEPVGYGTVTGEYRNRHEANKGTRSRFYPQNREWRQRAEEPVAAGRCQRILQEGMAQESGSNRSSTCAQNSRQP